MYTIAGSSLDRPLRQNINVARTTQSKSIWASRISRSKSIRKHHRNELNLYEPGRFNEFFLETQTFSSTVIQNWFSLPRPGLSRPQSQNLPFSPIRPPNHRPRPGWFSHVIGVNVTFIPPSASLSIMANLCRSHFSDGADFYVYCLFGHAQQIVCIEDAK